MSESRDPESAGPDPLDQLVAAAMRDPQVRKALKDDPRGTIARVLGVDVPRDVEIEVLEERPDKLFVVLPADPAELTESELDDVVAAGQGQAALSLARTRISRIRMSGPWMTYTPTY